jgi:hypothetical protein
MIAPLFLLYNSWNFVKTYFNTTTTNIFYQFKKKQFSFFSTMHHTSQMTFTKLFFGIFSLKIMALWGGVHVAELGSIQNWYWRTPQYLPVLVGHVASICLQIVIKIRIWARVFGTGPGLPLLLTPVLRNSNCTFILRIVWFTNSFMSILPVYLLVFFAICFYM